jgi:hypothetical protein
MGLFGKEKITLTLEKYDYKPGDKIKGTVKLNLKKPTKARKLEVSFIGSKTEKQTGMRIGPTTSNTQQTKTMKVYDFTLPLDGEKDYHEEEYPFDSFKNSKWCVFSYGLVCKSTVGYTHEFRCEKISENRAFLKTIKK